MKSKLLKLSEIVTTAGTQIRAKIDGDTVGQYAEAMQDATNKFPPVVVFHDGSQYILADGFHRVMAASRNRFLDIEADVRKGTHSDALKFALGANAAHGLKRTNADKRRSVELALAEWPKLSDRELAKVCAVSNEMVGDVRKSQVSDSDTCPAKQKRIGGDGKEYTVKKRTPQPTPEVCESASVPEVCSPAPEAPAEKPRVKSADEELSEAFDKVEFSKQAEKNFRAWLDKHYEASELPAVRNAIRAFLAKSEAHDGYIHKPF